MIDRLAILGASARAAAFSARSAGIQCATADLFADADLAAICPAHKIARYPESFREALPCLAADSWMYCGALENYPQLVDELAAACPLLGNSSVALRRVRDPFQLSAILSEAEHRFPTVTCDPAQLTGGQAWLVKPLNSAGGQHIHAWNGSPKPLNAGKYFQQRIEGVACSASFVAASGRSTFLGATRQCLTQAALPGDSISPSDAFRYAGSIGPLQLADKLEAELTAISQRLVEAAGLVGLFGIDFMISDDHVWLIEVNPRYTASMEVLERAGNSSFVELHIAACQAGQLPEQKIAYQRCAGKRIVFSDHDFEIDQACSDRLLEAANTSFQPAMADIPHAGERIDRGKPMLTLLVDGDDVEDVETELARAQSNLTSLLSV